MKRSRNRRATRKGIGSMTWKYRQSWTAGMTKDALGSLKAQSVGIKTRSLPMATIRLLKKSGCSVSTPFPQRQLMIHCYSRNEVDEFLGNYAPKKYILLFFPYIWYLYWYLIKFLFLLLLRPICGMCTWECKRFELLRGYERRRLGSWQHSWEGTFGIARTNMRRGIQSHREV